MDYPLDFQKMCQIDTRKLLLLTTTIAAFVLIYEFLSIPYGSVLLSIFPSVKVSFVGESDYSPGDSFANSQVNYNISTLNDSLPSNSSGSPVVVGNTDESYMGQNTNRDNEVDREKGKTDYNSVWDEDFDPEVGLSSEDTIDPNKNSTFRDIENFQNSSISDDPRGLRHGSGSRPQVSLDNVQNEGNSLTSDREQSEGSSSTSVAPAFPPVASLSNLTLPKKVDADLRTSVKSGNSNVSSVGEQATNTLSEHNQRTRVGTSNNFTLPSYSVPKDSLNMQTGQATPNNNLTMTRNTTQKESLEMLGAPITSISEMHRLLHKSRASSHSMIPRWSSVRDQEILSARSQIENPPIVKNDRDLYAPLFHNVSMFKRSYELMEQTLKVYIYKEGAKPIFHQPETKGIYASEGWFMKQMEGNRHFAVKDPRKAHLFYLPFSTRRLEEFLYVPNSHSHKNLIAYLKNYLDLISVKYPFWNRTGGADHFLVACHDWAPSETKRHMSSCIRALCNADMNEGFVMGKDVSLPETNVRQAKDPLRDIGGKPPSKRQTLAFFAGSMHGYVRPILLQYWENKDPDMKIYSHMGRASKSRTSYVQHMKNSKYCICAKGYEVNSPRVVEAIFYECVPVIISDNFVPPFFEVLNWEAFAVFVPEKDIPNLKNILLSIPEEKYLKLQMRVKKVQQHFLWHTKAVKYDIFHMILHSIWQNRVFQINLA